jgi:hypothetical protein
LFEVLRFLLEEVTGVASVAVALEGPASVAVSEGRFFAGILDD